MMNLDTTLNQAMETKANDTLPLMLQRGLKAGVFIGTGALLYSVTISNQGDANLLRFIGALLFTIGLNLVVFFKAQLFTGNNLMIFSLFDGKLKLTKVIKNWSIVYLANFIGAFAFALLCFYLLGATPHIGEKLIQVATIKTDYSFSESLIRAMLCNILVCCAIFLAIIFKKKTHKIIGVMIPITMFVYFGFEHSIANMFFIPLGFLHQAGEVMTQTSLFFGNIIPVTIGNILGGLIFSLIILQVNKLAKLR